MKQPERRAWRLRAVVSEGVSACVSGSAKLGGGGAGGNQYERGGLSSWRFT